VESKTVPVIGKAEFPFGVIAHHILKSLILEFPLKQTSSFPMREDRAFRRLQSIVVPHLGRET
jgi:hypothetical protein